MTAENTTCTVQNHEAILKSDGFWTIFQFEQRVIRFRTSEKLERYTKVLEWDQGYLVVMAKYTFQEEAIEEYIDLIPILENLYIQAEEFLKPIEKVKICYDRC